MTHISIENLSYSYPEEAMKALKDINIKIAKGECMLICGSSGSGKSTLAKCISGAIPNFHGGTIQGHIYLNNIEIDKMEHSERAKEITIVFQDSERQLIMNKVHREIAFGLENTGVPSEEIKRRVWETMEFFNISDLAYRKISSLSGGQKQKVAIASAMAYQPNCLILDEALSQMDPASAEEIAGIVRKINEELGITIIIIEQKIDSWFSIADKIGILEQGRMCFLGSKEMLYNNKNEYTLGFLPTYLKLSKIIGLETMPQSYKELKDCLNRNIQININEQLIHEFREEAIKVKGLKINYEHIQAIKNIDLSINKGEFLSILGANGAGKSTLLKSFTGLLEYSGSIRVLGNEVRKSSIKALALEMAFVAQNYNDYISKETVYEELAFTLHNFSIREEDVIDEILKKLDIYELKYRNPGDLSGGERQRVAIASMLVVKPKILLLDEPTKGLDFAAKSKLGYVLKDLNKDGTTIILVTHDVEFAAEFSQRFALMFNGEIAALGNRKEVLGDSIFYTTIVNKLARHINKDLFTLSQISTKGNGEA